MKNEMQVIVAVADAIKALGSIPSGHLYARLMPHMSLEAYQAIIGVLKQAKTRRGDASRAQMGGKMIFLEALAIWLLAGFVVSFTVMPHEEDEHES